MQALTTVKGSMSHAKEHSRALSSYRALAFDIIGTLIDFEAGIVKFLRPFVQRAGASRSDDEILEAYARTEQKQQGLHPESNTVDIFSLAWPEMSQELGLPAKPAPTEEYVQSVYQWAPFPDSVEALAYLKQHYTMFPITTGSTAATKRFEAKLQDPFHYIFTADILGFAKPDPRAFERALEQVQDKAGIHRDDILLVAQSQFHDIGPSKQVGLDTAWIERRHDQHGMGATPVPTGGLTTPTYHFKSMADFASACREAFNGDQP